MTIRRFLNSFEQVVKQSTTQQAISIASGSCGSMESYHRRCGRIEGMDESVALARKLLESYEKHESDADTPLPTMGADDGN